MKKHLLTATVLFSTTVGLTSLTQAHLPARGTYIAVVNHLKNDSVDLHLSATHAAGPIHITSLNCTFPDPSGSPHSMDIHYSQDGVIGKPVDEAYYTGSIKHAGDILTLGSPADLSPYYLPTDQSPASCQAMVKNCSDPETLTFTKKSWNLTQKSCS